MKHLCLHLLLFSPIFIFAQTQNPSTAKSRQSWQQSDSSETERGVIITPGIEVWYSRWKSFSYVAENDPEPNLMFCPSLGLKFRGFTIRLNVNKSFSENTNIGLLHPLRTIMRDVFEVGSRWEFDGKKDEKLLSTNIWYGSYRGSGFIDSYCDTISFERCTVEYKINSRIFYVDIFPESGMIGPWARFFGLRYLHYNAPASVFGREIPDPRNPADTLVWEEIADTRFNHVFLLVNGGKLFESLKRPIVGTKPQLRIDFHWYTLLLGLGSGRNKPMGKFFSYSSPHISSQIRGLVFNMEFDLALRLVFPRSKGRDTSIRLGARWTDWELISSKKYDLYTRSKDRYVGPYLKITANL